MKTSDINRLVQKLQSQKLTVAFAESCTAGMLASEFVKGKGTGSVLLGSIVTYNEIVKQTLLGVKKKTLELYSAESQQVTNEMVMGLHNLLNADFSISVTGLTNNGASEHEDTTEIIRKQTTEFIFSKLEAIFDKHFS
jgi:nicotinamide-nucleotide amidase